MSQTPTTPDPEPQVPDQPQLPETEEEQAPETEGETDGTQ
jgi:hypothetical protein